MDMDNAKQTPPLYSPDTIADIVKNGSERYKPKEPVTARMKWLLLGSGLIGLAAQAMHDDFIKAYAAMWIIYMAALCILHRETIRKAPAKLALLPFALTIVVMMILQSEGYSDEALTAINMLALPGILLIHALTSVYAFPKGREGDYIPLLIRRGFLWFFNAIGCFFRALGALFSKDGKTLRIWAGVLVAIPLAGVALALLISADAVMDVYAKRIFANLNIADLFVRCVMLFVFAAFSYSFLYNTKWGDHASISKTYARLGATAPRIVVGALILVYALFTAIQFVYLFGGYGLPAGLTYSEYAVEGFSQLIWVAVINFSVYAFCLTRVEEDKPLRLLLILLLAATGVILASSFTRLCLYIGAYNLTLKRVLAFWLLCYLTLVLVIGAIRLFKKELPMLRVAVISLIAWYTALNLVNLNALYHMAF